MISLYIQELHRYKTQELFELLTMREEKARQVLNRLKSYNFLKIVKASDHDQDMPEVTGGEEVITELCEDDPDQFYVFTFVGVIIISGCVLKCYPKYLPFGSEPKEELRQVIRVLEKYKKSKRGDVLEFVNRNEKESNNLLTIMLALLSDYHEHGIYNNSRDIIEENGSGEILWDQTINDIYAVLQDGRPYYTELKTRYRIQDEFDYFQRLHECILTEVSQVLDQTDLPDLFGVLTVHLSDEVLSDFGDTDYILSRIEKELNVEFNTRKQFVLQTMHAYIRKDSQLTDRYSFTLFGTNSFNLVWENVCAEVLNNQLLTPLKSLHFPIPLRPEYDSVQNLKNLIDKPIWYRNDYHYVANDTLIPDIITIANSHFMIFDAKYYVMKLGKDKSLKGQPGIESITKQYLYQLAYQKFIQEHDFNDVINCFLMPTAQNKVINGGIVSLPMLDALGLKQIQVRLVPANQIFAYYLEGKRIPHDFLEI